MLAKKRLWDVVETIRYVCAYGREERMWASQSDSSSNPNCDEYVDLSIKSWFFPPVMRLIVHRPHRFVVLFTWDDAQSAQHRAWCATGHHSMSLLLSLSLLQLTAASWANLGVPLSPSLDVETQSPQLLPPCCLWQSTQNMEHKKVPKDLKSYEIPSAGSNTRDLATSGMTHGKLLPLLGTISPTLVLQMVP